MKTYKYFFAKIKFLLKTEVFEEKPFLTLFRCLLLLLFVLFKIKIKFKFNSIQSNFIYTFKPYKKTGLGGKGQFISRELYEPFLKFGHKIFNKKFYFVDIGCSRGFFSMYLLNLKNLKSIGLCIDPLQEALDDFKEILKINKINRAKLINGVISAQKKKNKDIFRVNDLNGYYSIIKNTSFSDKKIKEKFKVNSFTLDQLIFDKRYIKKVDFIKIDTEGAEYEILTKSIKTIKKFKPIIYCEITRKKNMIFNLLKKNGYDFFTINKGRALNFNKQNFNGNILAVQKNSQLSKKERWPSG